LLFLVLTLVFGTVGVVQIVLAPPGAWFSWGCVFFGAVGTISFTRQLRAKRAPLAFDADEIEGQGLPRWDEIAEVHGTTVFNRAGRQNYIGLVPTDSEAAERTWNPVRRLLARADDRVVRAPINIPTNILRQSKEDPRRDPACDGWPGRGARRVKCA